MSPGTVKHRVSAADVLVAVVVPAAAHYRRSRRDRLSLVRHTVSVWCARACCEYTRVCVCVQMIRTFINGNWTRRLLPKPGYRRRLPEEVLSTATCSACTRVCIINNNARCTRVWYISTYIRTRVRAYGVVTDRVYYGPPATAEKKTRRMSEAKSHKYAVRRACLNRTVSMSTFIHSIALSIRVLIMMIFMRVYARCISFFLYII